MDLFCSQGFEIGSGFSGSRMTGSEHNDPFYIDEFGQVCALQLLLMMMTPLSFP